MYVREREEDYRSIHKKRIFSSEDLLVEHACRIYTRKIFDEVYVEFNSSLRYRSEFLESDGDELTFKVLSKSAVREEFVVRMNQVTKEGKCVCRLFEFTGIPCRHLHHVLFLRLYVEEIPPHFILKRWMKDANRSEVVASNGLVMTDDKLGTESMRISHYCRRSAELAYMFGKSMLAYNVAMELLDQAFEKVKQIDKIELEREHNDEKLDEQCASSAEPTMGDPHVSKTKGRRPDKGKETALTPASSNGRYKSSLEVSQTKKNPRACKTCHMPGHDRRNCQKRKSQQSTVVVGDAGMTDVDATVTDLTLDGIEME
ncbi:zinc finger protein [Macleaya cordata]|uniref:Protein FAR1-RELATED SEQUENCE n=1 Tax=Macleaya cordata TaxID=56857 RepID=A0A200PNV2_MACCD|nr:zinc finger protein [Macleaya cordata]